MFDPCTPPPPCTLTYCYSMLVPNTAPTTYPTLPSEQQFNPPASSFTIPPNSLLATPSYHIATVNFTNITAHLDNPILTPHPHPHPHPSTNTLPCDSSSSPRPQDNTLQLRCLYRSNGYAYVALPSPDNRATYSSPAVEPLLYLCSLAARCPVYFLSLESCNNQIEFSCLWNLPQNSLHLDVVLIVEQQIQVIQNDLAR